MLLCLSFIKLISPFALDQLCGTLVTHPKFPGNPSQLSGIFHQWWKYLWEISLDATGLKIFNLVKF